MMNINKKMNHHQNPIITLFIYKTNIFNNKYYQLLYIIFYLIDTTQSNLCKFRYKYGIICYNKHIKILLLLP